MDPAVPAVPAVPDALEPSRAAVLEAANRVNQLDFQGGIALLGQAHRAGASLYELAQTDHEKAAIKIVEEIIEICAEVFQSMAFRVERNPGRARQGFESVLRRAQSLVQTCEVDEPLLLLVRGWTRVIPLQIPLCSATENLMRGNVDSARFEVQRAEQSLFLAFQEIDVDFDRLSLHEIKTALEQHPLEALELVGAATDFLLTSSMIKLQYCIQTEKYSDEIEMFRRAKSMFDVLTEFVGSIDDVAPQLRLMQTMLKCCSALSAACGALCEGGHLVGQKDFLGAYERSKAARTSLDTASRNVFATGVREAEKFQEIILNLRMYQVPQVESRWRLVESHVNDIARYQLEIDELRRDRTELLKGLSSRIGVTVNSTNELNSAIENNIHNQLQFYDRALDQLQDVIQELRKPGTGVSEARVNEIEREVKKAKEVTSVEQKLKAVKGVVEQIQGIVAGAAKIAPPVITALGFLAKLVGM
jgi:hypothetical protein